MKKLRVEKRSDGLEAGRCGTWRSATISGSLLLVFFLLLMLLTTRSFAMVDPSAAYCTALGYDFIVESTAEGERGLCQLPNGETVDAWQFLQGEVAPEFSYCPREGYELKVVYDEQVCSRFMTDCCAVCVLEDGSEVEVTELMGLTFEETRCGDGTCGMPENYSACPEDCPSGSSDAYCDGVRDGIVDPDCPEGYDPDYAAEVEGFPIIPVVLAAVAVAAVVAVATLFMKRRGRPTAKGE